MPRDLYVDKVSAIRRTVSLSIGPINFDLKILRCGKGFIAWANAEARSRGVREHNLDKLYASTTKRLPIAIKLLSFPMEILIKLTLSSSGCLGICRLK